MFSPPRPSLRDCGCVHGGGGRPLFITRATSSFSPPSVGCGRFILFYIGGGTNGNLGRKKIINKGNSVVCFSFMEYTNSIKTITPLRDSLWEE